MTINSLSPIQSTPFTGLGTQTYNVTTTGLYTFGVKCTIPWMTSDQAYAVANPEVLNVQDVTCAGDTSGSRNSTWWSFYTAGNLHGYYVWYNINSAGVDPAPTGLTGIEVAGATNANATTLGGATRTAIGASAAAAYVAVTGATSHAILTNKQYGACTAAANGTASAGISVSTTTTGSYGYASGLTLIAYKNSTALMTLSNPTPTQASLSGSVVVQASAGDTLTLVASSLANVDQLANSVKGVINIFLGE